MILLGISYADKKSWISKLIDQRSGGLGACHNFIYYPELKLVFESHFDTDGPRFVERPIQHDREELYEFPNIDDAIVSAVDREFRQMPGKYSYDSLGVLHNDPLCHWVKQDPNGLYCTEAVVVGMKPYYFADVVPHEFTPNDTVKMVRESGWKRRYDV